ncbi:MAG: amidohydrolase family protein [Candidatus Odinarchaeota archaeon]
MQLIIKAASLRSTTGLKDIAIDGGKIIDIVKSDNKYSDSQFEEVIDASGSLVTESYASPHIHLDKTLIGESIVNQSGTLWEAIEKTWEYKRNYTTEDIVKRASRIIDKQIEYGVTKFRTHVDIDSIGGLKPVKGLLEVKKKYKDLIDLQIVAFPQEGIIKDEGTQEKLRKALEMGADILGGMPHNEMTSIDRIKHVKLLFDIAEEFKVPIDAHVDETDDPYSRTLEEVAAEAIRREFTLGLTADHTCALAAYDDYHAERVIGLVKEAKMNIVTNPPTNMVLQGRLDTGAQRVGITRIKELLDAGINVTIGQDCIMDPYYPYGKGDMLEVALLTGHAAKMTLPREIELLYDFITGNAFRMMGLRKYSMKPGSIADLVILKNTSNVWEAIRTQTPARIVIRKGKTVSESKYSVIRNYQ